VFNALSLLISLAILFFVIRFRIHVHVVYQGSSWVASPRRKQAGVKACSSSTRALLPISGRRAAETAVTSEALPTAMTLPVQDLQSALVNLGASKSRARATAQKVCQQHPGAGFDQLVRIAIQEVA